MLKVCRKVMVLCAIIAAVTAMPLFAQTNIANPALTPLESNTYEATAGLFRSTVDYSQDLHNYSRLSPEKWFGFIGATTNRFSDGTNLSAGFVKDFNGIYLGTWYSGNIMRISGGGIKMTKQPTYNDVTEELEQETTTTSYGDGRINTQNRFQFLIGVAGHGIRVGFYENLTSNQHPAANDYIVTDAKDGHKGYEGVVDEYSLLEGSFVPYVGYGTRVAIGESMGLRPYVELGMDIYSDKEVNNFRSYDVVNGKKTNISKDVGAGRNAGYLTPFGALGAKLDMNTESGTATIGLEYGIAARIYNNSYDPTGFSGSAKGTVAWGDGKVKEKTTYVDRTETLTNMTFTINEQTFMTHRITPSFQLQGSPAEGLRLGFKAAVPLTFNPTSSKKYTEVYDNSVSKFNSDRLYNDRDSKEFKKTYDADTEVLTATIALNMGVGAGYELLPGRFAINAGISMTPCRFNSVKTTDKALSVQSYTTTKVKDGAGNQITNNKTVTASEDPENSVEVVNTWDSFTGRISGGFVFYFNDKFALDMSSTASTTTGFNLDLSSVNVLLTVNF